MLGCRAGAEDPIFSTTGQPDFIDEISHQGEIGRSHLDWDKRHVQSLVGAVDL
jgi:hypothetical protein